MMLMKKLIDVSSYMTVVVIDLPSPWISTEEIKLTFLYFS